MNNKILFDDRWSGPHGIGRMTTELRLRLFDGEAYQCPAWPISPVSPIDPLIRGLQLVMCPKHVFYSPGFNPPFLGRRRAVFTICDLIHLKVQSETGALKSYFYEWLVKPAVHNCFRVLTISEYSRSDVLEWSGADPAQLVNVGCGIDEQFFARVTPWQPGFPYFLYVGARKPHKNLDRLLTAYAASTASKEIWLVLSGLPEPRLMAEAARLGIADRLIFAGRIPDEDLSAYYQGAVALLFPSYFEGFGLPPLEAMAGGTPALTSNVTSLPEVVGEAAVTVDPFSIDELRNGIEKIAFDNELRSKLIAAGPVQARLHSWDAVADKVTVVLTELRNSIK